MPGTPLPYERQPGEAIKAYAAFCVYRDLGACRGLRDACRRFYGESVAKRGQIEQWSKQWNSVERAKAGLSNEKHVWVATDVRILFGKRMRELRQRAGISQEALADRCGLHRTYVGGIERGERNPSLMNIARIAKALNVSLEDLFRSWTGRRVKKN